MPIDPSKVKWDTPDPAQIQWDDAPKKPSIWSALKPELPYGDIAAGALSGAASIGSTILAPIDAAARAVGISNSFIGRDDRRKATRQGLETLGADPESLAFKGAELGTQIAGTAGAPVAAARGLAMIPRLAQYAPVLASGGFNLGNAATGSSLANAGIRAAGGAAGGAMQAGLVNPSDTGTGAAIGAATPGAIKLAGATGDLIRRGGESASRYLMQSALKPTLEALRTGKAERAVDTLLREGINPTAAGVEKLGAMVDDIDRQVSGRIANSGQTVSKRQVLGTLNDKGMELLKQVNPDEAIAAVAKSGDEFLQHPLLASGDAIPVQLAQDLKTGTYQTLKKQYGEAKGPATEAQKALARGLKEAIEQAVPAVGPLNRRQSELINALKVAERRALVDANKNPMGLAILAGKPGATAAFLADRSALIKGLLARGVNRATNLPVPQGVPQLLEQYGVLGAPSVALTSP